MSAFLSLFFCSPLSRTFSLSFLFFLNHRNYVPWVGCSWRVMERMSFEMKFKFQFGPARQKKKYKKIWGEEAVENSAENGKRLGAKEKLSSSGQREKEFNSFQLGIVCSLFFSHPLCFSLSFMAHTWCHNATPPHFHTFPPPLSKCQANEVTTRPPTFVSFVIFPSLLLIRYPVRILIAKKE